jgi:hypothetical protein
MSSRLRRRKNPSLNRTRMMSSTTSSGRSNLR